MVREEEREGPGGGAGGRVVGMDGDMKGLARSEKL